MLVKDKDGNITGYDLSKDPIFTKMASDNADLVKLVKGLTPIVQQVLTQNSEFKTKLAALEAGGGNSRSKDDNGDNGDIDDDVDISKLDNSKFQKLLLGEVGKLLDERLKPLNETVTGVRKEFMTDRFRAEAKDLKGKFKDFTDWEDEMAALAKNHPSLNLRQLRAMAREESPDKAKELDEKYKEKPENKEEITMFGGYRPSTGTETGGKGEQKLTSEEAGEKAWTETVSQFPGFEKFAGDDKVFV